MKKIIVNADDFGYTSGCNEGIIKAMEEGIVTSTTVMMNMGSVRDGIALAKEHGIYAMGVHLNLTKGCPILSREKVRTLVDGRGEFRDIEEIIGCGDRDEIKQELRAQIESFLDTGMELTHLDSHHHIHSREVIGDICIELSNSYGVPMRRTLDGKESSAYCSSTDSLSTDFYGEMATVETLKKIIREAPDGIIEIMTHPGLVDEELKEKSSYNVQRFSELQILISEEIKEWIAEQGIELVSYN